MPLEYNRMLKKYVNVTLNQVLNLIQDLTISGSRKIPILLDAELVKNLRTVTPAEAGVQVSFNLLDSRSPIKDFEDKFHGNDTF
jgi:hypothetical protein